MPSARLEAFLGLNTREFQRALVKARRQANEFAKRGLQAIAVASVAAGTALAAGSRRIIGLGGDLEHLSQQTGVAVKDLIILQQAFEDNGVSSDNARLAINKMQKTLVEAGEGLSEPTKAFQALGLSVDEMRNLSAVDQFRAIGEAIKRIEDPAERSAAAMRIFGRSGAELQSVFAGSKLEDVEASLGRMPEVIDQFSTALERADTLIGRMKNRADQFFAGFATEVVGSILQPLEDINQLDFVGLGQNLGKVVRPWIEAVTSGEIWDLVELKASQAVAGFVGDSIDAAQEIGRVIVTGLKSAFAVAADFFLRTMVENTAKWFDMLAKTPLVGGIYEKLAETIRSVGPAGEAKTFAGTFAENFAPTESSEFGQRFRDAWQPEIDAVANRLKLLGDAHTEAAAGMKAVANAAGSSTSNTGATAAITDMTRAADAFARKFGFTIGDAASGKRGGGIISHRARERLRIEQDAQRMFDQSARFAALGNTEDAERFRAKAEARFAEAQAIQIPGVSATPGIAYTDPGPSGITAPARPTQPPDNSDIIQELRALISEIRRVGERIGVGPATL